MENTAIYKLALALAILVLSGCKDLGFVASEQKGAISGFIGVKSINVTPDGRYILFWDHPAITNDIAGITYEVYMDKWESLPTDLSAATALNASASEEGRVLGSRFIELDDAKAPVGLGLLLSSVKGVRSYTLDQKIQPDVIYAFQVRASSNDGQRDKNQRVMVYSAAENKINFGGVSGLTMTPTGKLMLNWDVPSDLPKTISPGDISYEIYMDSTPDSIESVLAAGTIAIDTSAALTDDAGRFGKLINLPAERLPERNVAPLMTQRGGRVYELSAELSPSLTYIFQVKARGPGSEPGDSSRVLVYRRGNLVFAGLPTNGAVLSEDLSKITLTWQAATGAVGPVTYTIYGDANFTTPLTTTKDTSYEFQDVKPGNTYTFAVRAQDSNGFDSNRSFAIVKVGALNFAGLQQSGVSVKPDKSAIELSWAPATQAKGPVNYVIYDDGKFSSVIGQTSNTSFTIANPVPGRLYTLGVRARDSNGFDDNTSLAMIKITPLDFAGLQQSGAVLAADNSKIDLSWTAASNSSGTVSYIIYQDANFSTILGQTTQTSYIVPAPTPGRTYTLGVRAKDSIGFDTNTNLVLVTVPDLSDRTPPNFAGLSTASAVSDNKILLRWAASPSADVSAYNVYYAHDLNTPLASTANLTFVVTGLTPATSYSFIVRAKDASGNEEKNTVSKSAMTLPYAVPNFAGVEKIENLGGVDGLTKLKVSWLRAGGAVSGYKIYAATSTGGQDFDAAILEVAGGTTTNATLTGLDSNTTYYIVVRAYDSSSGTVALEQNTVEKSLATLQVRAPTFAGITSATPGAGGLGFTTATANWGTPQTDGVYDGFVVEYEAGTCASSFSGAPTALTATGAATRSATITGLTAQTTYRLRVRTLYSPTSIKDANTACQEVYTAPPAPVFSGVGSVSTVAGIAGFTSLAVTWPQASSSFSYYKIEWSTTANFATVGGTSQVTSIGSLSRTLASLPAKTTIYVRVSAVFDENGVQLSAGASKVLSAKTEPPSPTGEGISSVSVLAADSLKVAWTAPSNAGAVYNGFKLWKYCGASAASNLIAKLSGAADNTYPAGQLNATFSGLASNTECCYQVRAYYDDGSNTLTSQSTLAQQCQTPTLVAPTFAGVTSVTNNNQATGFNQLTVSWSAVDASEAGLFSYYEIAYATTPTGQNWTSGTIKVTDRSMTSRAVTGLSENTTYYFRVRAVNNNGTPAVSNGSDTVANATTTPMAPIGDNLSAVSSLSATKAQLTYGPPSSNANNGGLFNSIFLFVQAGTTNDVASYRSSVETSGVTSGEISGTISAGKITLTSVPALVRVPTSEITADQNNNYQLWGLTANQQVCIQAVAVYWVDGQASKYLPSSTPTTHCVTPTAGAPSFAGVSGLTGFNDLRDFTQMVVNWGTISGDCTSVEISVTTTPNTPDFATPKATATCSDTSKTIAGLSPHLDYYVQVRALNTVSGVSYAAGQGVELTRKTRPPTPTGDGMVSAVATAVAKAPDTMTLTYSEASAGYWNKVYIWRATNSVRSSAETAVRAAATTKADNTGPTAAPWIIKSPGSTTASDSNITAGLFTCYLARAVYEDGSYYYASANETIQCDRTAYTTPSFSGVASGSVIGAWPDGTAKIELTLNSPPAGSIEEYNIYFSETSSLATFNFNTPLATVDFASSTYDANAYDNKLLLAIPASSLRDGYYIVRYKFYSGPDTDSNNSISTLVQVLPGANGYVWVPKQFSGLAYDYYIMRHEASWTSGGSAPGTDAVTTSESELATCSYEFHGNNNAAHANCGSRAITKIPQSVANTAPATGVTWSEAFFACRNASDSNIMARLPTREEWLRAARWVGTSYQTMWDTYSNNAAANCLVNGASAANTGAASNCKSALGLYDMAGNVKEWVDSRMLRYDIAANGESRFSYGPVIGRTLANGIDNISRRWHLIDPGANGLNLALGADYTTPTLAERKQYGTDVQNWIAAGAASAATGFRCVAFRTSSMPTMSQLALPTEPVFTADDISGAASTWKIPENLYVKDTRWESLSIVVNGVTTDQWAEGKVTISWKPWSKTVCTPTCTPSDAISYKLYRFVEPTLSSSRIATPWALVNPVSNNNPNPYSSDKPLDPLAVNSTGNPLYTSSTSDGKLIATISNCNNANPANCSFDDSEAANNGFSTRKIYNYLLVAQDAAGNQIPGMAQRWRSPYFAGDPAVSGAASFRLEPRYRRAAVFLVDEAHQQSRTQPQIMVHVPMDQSGLDHDFFMHKYEASAYDGSVSNNAGVNSDGVVTASVGSSAWPLQADANGAWLANAGRCEDIFQRTGSLNISACGNTANIAATTVRLQSKQTVAPQATIDQGAFWKACRNTGLTDADSNIYYLSLPSDAEWLKAADWGDLDLNGTIDVNPIADNVAASIAALETGSADTTTVRCHTDSSPGSAYAANSTQTANCRSRFGAADMVGNVWEWTTGQIFTAVGYDNGSDGLWLGQTLVTTAQTKYDLVRGFYKSSAAPTITLNGDGMWYQTSLRASIRGGSWGDGAAAGRWALYVRRRSVGHGHEHWRALPPLSPAEKISDQRFSLQRLALLPARSAG